MSLKLGELVAYLRTDNSRFRAGLGEAKREFSATGRELEAESDRIGGSTGDKTAGGFLARFKGGIAGLPGIVSGGFSGMPPQVQGAVVLAAAAIGAVFAAGLAAAVLLGLGGGVLAAGIMLAVKDPKVAAAWKTFGERAKKSLSGFTDAFKGPVTRAAGTFGAAMERMQPAFSRIGKDMAPIIDKLAPALADMAEKAMPGIEKALKASKPLFDKLAEHLPKIGDAVSSFFDSMADAGPGAVIFLDLILTTFEGLIRFWGNGIEFWAKTLVKLKTFFTKTIPDAWHWLVDKIKGGVDRIGGFFTTAKNWIVKKWDQVVDFVKGLPKKISRAASGMWNGIKDSFRSAINWVIRKWNGLSFRIPGLSVPGVGQIWGGATLSTPNIPMLAKGGTALTAGAAIVGERGPELLHMPRGATVQPLPAGGGHAEVRHTGEFRVRGSDLVLVLRETVATRGGNVQKVVGSNN